MAQPVGVNEFLDRLPEPEEVQRRLLANIQETRTLRKLLRLSKEQQATREAKREASPCRQ